MPRAHLSKRLSDADAIALFAEHHITQVRRRKNGEIVAVKHVQFGWLEPETYYQLQKMHDLLENSKFGGLLGDFIRGGYQLKWALANVSVAGVPVVGASLYGWAVARAVERLIVDGRSDRPDIQFWAKQEATFLLAGVLLPFGEALLIWAIVRNSTMQPINWYAFFSDFIPPLAPLFLWRPGPPPHGGGGTPGPTGGHGGGR